MYCGTKMFQKIDEKRSFFEASSAFRNRLTFQLFTAPFLIELCISNTPSDRIAIIKRNKLLLILLSVENCLFCAGRR